MISITITNIKFRDSSPEDIFFYNLVPVKYILSLVIEFRVNLCTHAIFPFFQKSLFEKAISIHEL